MNDCEGKTYGEYKRVQLCLWGENEYSGMIFDFTTSYNLIIVNTHFKKRDKYLITYKGGHNCSQIDFFLTRKMNKVICKNCKVIPSESLANQHRLMALDIHCRK